MRHPEYGESLATPCCAPLTGLVAAAPDLCSAGLLCWVWIDPTGWRRAMVGEGMLIMLVEFILVHSAPFLGGAVLARGQAVGSRLKLIGGLGLFYGLFLGVWSWMFKSWWPLLMFAWLLGSKLLAVLSDRQTPAAVRLRQQGLWGASVAYYLLAVLVTLVLPVPELGITHHGRYYGIPGSGEWVSHPQVVVAAGVLYFGLLAVTKLCGWDAAWGRAARKGRSGQP